MINQILDVDQSLGFQRNSQTLGIIQDLFHKIIGQAPCRINGNGVSGVNAGSFDMLHDAGDQDIRSIADSIDLKLGPHHVLVDQNRVFDILGKDNIHIFVDIFFVKGDDHVLSPQDVGGSEQDRIADFIRRFKGLLLRHDGIANRPFDLKLFQKLVKAFSILRPVDAVGRGPKDPHAVMV